jgi:hypothetical protein
MSNMDLVTPWTCQNDDYGCVYVQHSTFKEACSHNGHVVRKFREIKCRNAGIAGSLLVSRLICPQSIISFETKENFHVR